MKFEGTIRKTSDGEEKEYWSDDDGNARGDDRAGAPTLSTYLGPAEILQAFRIGEKKTQR